MNAPELLTYRFANNSQWRAGALTRGSADDTGIVPLPRLRETAISEYSGGPAFCPAVSRRGELFWCDANGHLHVRPPDDPAAWQVPAPSGIGDRSRLVAWRSWLWALDKSGGRITRYFADTLQQAETIEASAFVDPDTPGQACQPIDIAPDGHDGLWVLAKGNKPRLFHIGLKMRHPHMLSWSASAGSLATVNRGKVIAVLDTSAGTLGLVNVSDGSVRPVALDSAPSGFKPSALAANGTDRILLAGTVALPAGSTAGPFQRLLLVFDADGNPVDQVPIGIAPDPNDVTALAALRDMVWIADADGLRRLQSGAGGADRPISANFLTPTLISPEGKDRSWLRAELMAELPPGATLQVKFATSSDAALIANITRILSGPATTPAQRRARVEQLLPQSQWSVCQYQGAAAEPCGTGDPVPPATRTVPLHTAFGTALWLAVELRAAAPDQLPKLLELNVCYPELSLMRHLPAIYRSKEGDRDGLLRSLVEVLEATTHGLQERIERLGTLVDPKTAPAEWLDFLAAWLGMPWHEALALQLKRSLLSAAGVLLGSRGTRAGLLRMLKCLLPETQVRIVDSSVDLSPAMLAGSNGAGATYLPAVLLGRPHSNAVLGSPHTVLGRTHLKCADEVQCPRDLIEGHLRIEIAAEAADNAEIAAILPYMIRDYVPIGLRIDLRWRSAGKLGFGRRLDQDLVLESYRPAALDRRTVVGRSFLPSQGIGKLASDGLATGFRLG
jgi:phage tail-like protein